MVSGSFTERIVCPEMVWSTAQHAPHSKSRQERVGQTIPGPSIDHGDPVSTLCPNVATSTHGLRTGGDRPCSAWPSVRSGPFPTLTRGQRSSPDSWEDRLLGPDWVFSPAPRSGGPSSLAGDARSGLRRGSSPGGSWHQGHSEGAAPLREAGPTEPPRTDSRQGSWPSGTLRSSRPCRRRRRERRPGRHRRLPTGPWGSGVRTTGSGLPRRGRRDPGRPSGCRPRPPRWRR